MYVSRLGFGLRLGWRTRAAHQSLTYNDRERDTKIVHQAPIAFQLLLISQLGQPAFISRLPSQRCNLFHSASQIEQSVSSGVLICC